METGLKTHGITEATLQNLMFSAGAYYKNLKVPTSEQTTWTGTPLGATSGGGGLTVEPEYLTAELDGATVTVKGATQKVGEVGKMKINLTELTEGLIADTLHLKEDATANVNGFKKYETRALITDDDYLDNIAFVGKLVDGRQVIVIMENAICLSAFELDTKDKEQAVFELEMTCTADINQDDLNHLPIHIYFPQVESV